MLLYVRAWGRESEKNEQTKQAVSGFEPNPSKNKVHKPKSVLKNAKMTFVTRHTAATEESFDVIFYEG